LCPNNHEIYVGREKQDLYIHEEKGNITDLDLIDLALHLEERVDLVEIGP
jgi:hypothetical protein